MSVLSRAALRELLEEQGGWCVSLFMPAHSVGREVQQDPIRL